MTVRKPRPTSQPKRLVARCALELIGHHLEIIRTEYSVSRIWVFGSFARAEQVRESDIDILAEFENDLPAERGVDYHCLRRFLQLLFPGRVVDLFALRDLKYDRAHVLTEAIEIETEKHTGGLTKRVLRGNPLGSVPHIERQ